MAIVHPRSQPKLLPTSIRPCPPHLVSLPHLSKSFQNKMQNRSERGQTNNHSEHTNEPKEERSSQSSNRGQEYSAGILPSNSGHHSRFWKKIHEDGESGRKGFHPYHFLHCCWMSSNTISMCVNVLWPVVPVAIAVVSLGSRTGMRNATRCWMS